jgi:hypothetical protein
MPVIGNLGQQGQKGAFEVLGIKHTTDKDGLITVEIPAVVEKEAEAPKAEEKDGGVKK